MKPSKIAQILIWLIDKIPPRGVEVEFFLCADCGKMRLMGDLHREIWRAYCPRCGSNKVRAPKGNAKKLLFRVLWASLFRRKALLYGLDMGLHSHYKAKQPSGLEAYDGKKT